MTSTSLPTRQSAYAYDPATGEYMGAVTVYLDPVKGSYPLPDHVVAFGPAHDAPVFTAWRLTASRDAWKAVDDFRRTALYDTDTTVTTANTLGLGDALPDGVTTSRPIATRPDDRQCNRWNPTRASWQLVPDFSAVPVWEKANGQQAARLAPGEALPLTLTTVPPPVDLGTAVRWDANEQGWVAVPSDAPNV